jgi:hypothetical protein
MPFPATCETGVEHDRIAAPSTCTVQAPQNPAPQPNFVPVSSSVSRNTQSNGVSGGHAYRFLVTVYLQCEVGHACSILDLQPNNPTQRRGKKEREQCVG